MGEKGLRGVIAGNTALSTIDGTKGELIYQGIDIHDLAQNSTFEETAYLLWFGRLPTREQLDELSKELLKNRELDSEIIDLIKLFPKDAPPMGALRTAVSQLGLYDPDPDDDYSREVNLKKAIRLTAKMSTFVAAYDRIRNGNEPIQPDPNLGHAANFLYMLNGERPDEDTAEGFDLSLILHADHGFNASTFSSRVTIATLSDMYSAVVSALGTLKGPLHGGANEQVIRLVLKIGDVDKAEGYVKDALARQERIMGFGHAVYKTEDPRVPHLRRLSKKLGEKSGNSKWYEISRKIEDTMMDAGMGEKGIWTNVDFYSASVYYAMGIPLDLFTPIFAVSRIVGWTGHIIEQLEDNRIIRPKSQYIGPRDVPYVPVDER